MMCTMTGRPPHWGNDHYSFKSLKSVLLRPLWLPWPTLTSLPRSRDHLNWDKISSYGKTGNKNVLLVLQLLQNELSAAPLLMHVFLQSGQYNSSPITLSAPDYYFCWLLKAKTFLKRTPRFGPCCSKKTPRAATCRFLSLFIRQTPS